MTDTSNNSANNFANNFSAILRDIRDTLVKAARYAQQSIAATSWIRRSGRESAWSVVVASAGRASRWLMISRHDAITVPFT